MAFNFFMRRKGEKKVVVTASDQKKPERIPEKREEKEEKVVGEKPVYAFIDASNLFWGGKESMGFSIDYKKLLEHLAKKHGVSKVFYYGGVRIFDFEFSILDNKLLDLAKVSEYLKNLKETADEKDKDSIEKSQNKINFYQLLESFGYIMKIKPAKVFYDIEDVNEEKPILKANCDVDMTFDMLRYMQQYSAIVVMTGDGDFAPVLSYLKYHDRKVTVFSRWTRTAKEIKTVAGDNFVDFEKLRREIQYY